MLDPNGNVVGEKTVYNAITGDGKSYIYNVLAGSTTTVAAINVISFYDTATSSVTNSAVLTDGTNDINVTGDGEEPASCNATSTEATCTANFGVSSYSTGSSPVTLTLKTGIELRAGNGDDTDGNPNTDYFNKDSSGVSIPVSANTTVTQIQIQWTIQAS